jgi:hypothetical protein
MLDNSRTSAWIWGAALALVCHSTFGETPAPAHVPPAYNAGVTNAIIVCAFVSTEYASVGAPIKGGDLPFTYGIAPIAGAPYSALGVTNSATTFIDGNRISRRETTRFFRDSQGRTRVEHTSPPPGSDVDSSAMPAIVLINDPVKGECYVLETPKNIAHVLSHPDKRGVMQPPIALGLPAARLVMPGFDIADGAAFALAATYSSPQDQVSLGNKTIDGIPVVGIRLKHQVRAGDFGNEQPIFVTVEQWFSSDLGIAIEDTQHTTIGGEVNYRLQQITRSEPDPALFQVPPGYKRKLETRGMLRVEVHADQPHPPVQLQPPPPPHPPKFVPCGSPRSGADSSPQPSHIGQPEAPAQAGNCFELIFE